MSWSVEWAEPSRRQARFARLVAQYNGETGLAWARTEALGDLVLDDLNGDRDDVGVRVLSNQLSLAAAVTLHSGDLDVAATHHDRFAAELESVMQGRGLREDLGSARLAHLLAAEICRGDLRTLGVHARTRHGSDYAEILRLPAQ